MPTLYLVRHGENIANLTREFSHRLIDYSLTPVGVMQAQQTAEYFRSLPIGAIYTSPLKRAKETAEIIARPLGLEVQVVEQFREINVGLLERQPPTAENWAFHDRIFHDWLNGKPGSTFPEGENHFSLLARMRAGLAEVVAHTPDNPGIIVGHGGIFMATIKDICQDIDVWQLTSLPNCSVTEIEAEIHQGQLTCQLRRWADASHLNGQP